MRPLLLLPLVLVLSSTLVCGAERTLKVTVEAGEYERQGTVVWFPLPAKESQPAAPAPQIEEVEYVTDGTNAVFVLDSLAKGKSKTILLSPPNPARYPSGRIVSRATNDVKWGFTGATITQHRTLSWAPHGSSNTLCQYQPEPGPFPRENIKELFRRGGYLHPIRTLSGRTVTDDYPPNHIHHHGIWWAWTKTEFDGRKPDFWNMGDGKGRVVFMGMEEPWGGAPHGGFRARHSFVDLTVPTYIPALREEWQVAYYRPFFEKGYWLFDLVSEQRCATTNALKLPQYHYGGLGLRGNWAWNGAGKVNILTAEGETDRVKANTQKARWCDLWGKIDGADCGIAVLCHPSNFRAPQPMRVHPTEPFFCYAPQQGGDMEIKPGDTYISRYRFVVHDGPPDRRELDRLWNDYAHPPVVRVTVE